MPLNIEGVSKSFPSPAGPKTVLSGVSFEVPAGGCVCLLGPNGSGKTTLLKCISTLLIPEAGRVLWDGADLHKNVRAAKHSVGFASTEDQSFYGRLTGRMNLWFYGRMYGLPEGVFRDRLADLDRLLDLAPGLAQPYRELSSGVKQRFLIARALVHDPAVVILDEPHQNLDPGYAVRLRDVLKNELNGRRKKTILVSTHHLEDAAKMSDQWVLLSRGRICFRGSLAEARARHAGDLEGFFEKATAGV